MTQIIECHQYTDFITTFVQGIGVRVRIISARKATKNEIRQYKED